MILTVKSSKTLQYQDLKLEIPVYSVLASPLCATALVPRHFAQFPMEPEGFLLYKASPSGPVPIIYRDLLSLSPYTHSLLVHEEETTMVSTS